MDSYIYNDENGQNMANVYNNHNTSIRSKSKTSSKVLSIFVLWIWTKKGDDFVENKHYLDKVGARKTSAWQI